MLDWLDTKSLFTIIHLLGVAVGAGGAYMSDAMFFSSVKDEKISKTEIRFLKIGSMMVWFGLFLLVLSGLGLFFLDVEGYLDSAKFLAKATIVLIITLNGLFFHHYHMPFISRHENEHFPSSDEFMRKHPLLLTSGAISFVSWTSAIILGVLSGIPYPYLTIMGMYFSVLLVAVIFANIFLKHRHRE